MRKLLYIFIGLILFSCSDELEQVPTDKLPSDEAITTVADLQLAVNGVYASMVSVWNGDQTIVDGYCGDFGLYADAKGGDINYQGAYNHLAPVINLQTDKNSDEADGFYYINYVGIARVNDILTVVENISDIEDNKAEYDDLVGQLHAIRGFLHFDVLRTFCAMPNLVADQTAAKSGIVISNEKYLVNTRFTRSTMKESYDFVKAEFEFALTTIGEEVVIGEMNYWTVKALRSRMHLYLGENSAALADAVDVIENSPYDLLMRDEWVDSWTIEGATETLFEIRTSDTENAQRNSIGYYTAPGGYAEAAASDEFLSFFNTLSADDIRINTLKEEDDDGDYQAFYPQKYRGRSGVTSPLYVNNPKIIRLSEVYYIASEAVLQGGTATNAKSAVEYYNAVRSNRIDSYTDVASVTLDNILDERRIELFCENARVFDLIRLKTEFDHPRFADPIQVTDSRLITSFPQRELDVNSDL
ncbi:MAG: RagB/SusD family nutrient uptake outer membrane protein [Bacteroidales bacterium]|nr:MAG: RagB/SusD family nutrient uptake outer membrane protein [Bacteroidales bacterium]